MPVLRLNRAALIKHARRHGDESAAAISRTTGVPESTLSALLSGQRAPAMPTLVALASPYGLASDDLLKVRP
ncbi:helix-turn-helix transcriptional regulator [Streptomyces sp. NA04227]|nr:helix-turn-helix transcriptional regulator [Streptomyces sp. NA04227]